MGLPRLSTDTSTRGRATSAQASKARTRASAGTGVLGGMSVCVIVRFLEVSVQGLWGYAPFLIQNLKKPLEVS